MFGIVHDKAFIMYVSLIKIFPPEGRTQSIVDIFEAVKGPIASHPDCCGCSVAVEIGQDEVINYCEQWQTRDALERHLRSGIFNRILEAMECSTHSPEICFFEARIIGGLELIEWARSTDDLRKVRITQ